MNNPNNSQKPEGERSDSENPWASLGEFAGKFNASEKQSAENLNKEKTESTFMAKELKRIAEATGRVPDDEEVAKLNLALRYQKYQQYQDIYNNAKETGTMLQQGTLEDIATAKRELEEAMYLYDSSFADMDREKSRKDLKDSYKRQAERVRNGDVHQEAGYYLKAYQARKEREEGRDGKRKTHYAGYNERRASSAENLSEKLPGILNDVMNSEIFKTYELNKEADAEPIKNRRAGLQDAGKGGLFVDGKIDWALHPHAPKAVEKTPEPTPETTKADKNIDIFEKMKNGIDIDTLSDEERKALIERLTAGSGEPVNKPAGEAADQANKPASEAVESEADEPEESAETEESTGEEVDRRSEIRKRLSAIKERLGVIFKRKQELREDIDNINETLGGKVTQSKEQAQRELDEINSRIAELENRVATTRNEVETEQPKEDTLSVEIKYENMVKQRNSEMAKSGNEAKFGNQLDYNFWNSIGHEGLEIMTDNEELNDQKSENIRKWWNSLNNSAKESLLIENESLAGNALGNWLIKNNLLPKDKRTEIKDYYNELRAKTPEEREDEIQKQIGDRTQRAIDKYNYWTGIGEEGLEIINDETGLTDEKNDKIANWWNTLDSEVKRQLIKDYKNDTLVRMTGLGTALNVWLQMQTPSDLE